MIKVLLWLGAMVLGYMAWKSGDLHEKTGDVAYLKEALAWGGACLVCVGIAVFGKFGAKADTKSDAGLPF
jgi:hypothetical protein